MVPAAVVAAAVEVAAVVVRAVVHPAVVAAASVVVPVGAAVVAVVARAKVAVAHFAAAATAAVVHAVHFVFGQGFLHVQLLVFDRVGFAHFIDETRTSTKKKQIHRLGNQFD